MGPNCERIAKRRSPMHSCRFVLFPSIAFPGAKWARSSGICFRSWQNPSCTDLPGRMNIVEPILYQSRYHPPAAAICAPGAEPGLVSYARLEQFVHNISRKAVALGLSRGQVVAIFVRNRILHAAIILGLARLGVITISLRDSNLPESLRIDALIGDALLPQLTAMRAIQADLSWTMGDGKPTDVVDHDGADDICRLVPTSGTVSGSRIIALTHRMIFARIARYHFVF